MLKPATEFGYFYPTGHISSSSTIKGLQKQIILNLVKNKKAKGHMAQLTKSQLN